MIGEIPRDIKIKITRELFCRLYDDQPALSEYPKIYLEIVKPYIDEAPLISMMSHLASTVKVCFEVGQRTGESPLQIMSNLLIEMGQPRKKSFMEKIFASGDDNFEGGR